MFIFILITVILKDNSVTGYRQMSMMFPANTTQLNENENQKYIKCSDLIIYTSSITAPT